MRTDVTSVVLSVVFIKYRKQSLKPGPGTRASIATDNLIDLP
jgi:hypothetical protein